MDYDFIWAQEPIAVTEALAALNALYGDETASWEDLDAAHRRYREVQQAAGSHLTWGYSGLSPILEAMREVGMVFDSPVPDWPDHRAFGLPDCYDESRPEYARYEAVCEVVRRSGYERLGIPSYKFTGSDGWPIDPGEIRSAFAVWEERVSPDLGVDGWQEWFAWLRRATKHGGVRVQ